MQCKFYWEKGVNNFNIISFFNTNILIIIVLFIKYLYIGGKTEIHNSKSLCKGQ